MKSISILYFSISCYYILQSKQGTLRSNLRFGPILRVIYAYFQRCRHIIYRIKYRLVYVLKGILVQILRHAALKHVLFRINKSNLLNNL